MITVAIDPGVRGVGLAFGDEKELHHARYVPNPVEKGDDPAALFALCDAVVSQVTVRVFSALVSRVAIEVPRVYPGPQQKGDQNDLIPLAGIVHALGFFFHKCGAKEVIRYYPRDWKGSVSSNTTATRILDRLSDDEQKRIDRIGHFSELLARYEQIGKEVKDSGSVTHNTIDAVGIYLKAVGRFERVRIFPGSV
jgi:hypothetical protein